jgi:hypothetical protein
MEHLIPVAFDVTAPDEQTAAVIVARTIGRDGLLDAIQDASRRGDDEMIESWWFPEARHKHIDGNDNAAMTLDHRNDLAYGQVQVRVSDDPVKSDMELTCTRCEQVLCDVTHNLDLSVLVGVALSHPCPAT